MTSYFAPFSSLNHNNEIREMIIHRERSIKKWELNSTYTTVRSTTETSAVGTRNAIPVSFPFNEGITFPTALAAPVDDGITFIPTAPRPPRQSFREGPSTVGCVALLKI